MAKHDPTRQHKELYHELNIGDTGHTVPHKDLDARSSLMDQSAVHYSKVIGGVNAKSPVQVRQIDGFKSHHGNLEKHPMAHNTFGQSHGNEKQIPNTKPKHFEANVAKQTVHHKSKSLIFHG